MNEEPQSTQTSSQGGQKKKLKWKWLFGLILLGIIIGTGYWLLFMRNRVSTDDAYVTADIATISSRVPGSIASIDVENDDHVNTGDVLVKLDDRDYQAGLDAVNAELSAVESNISIAEVKLRLTDSQTDSQIQAAGAATKSSEDRERMARHKLQELMQNRTSAEAGFIQAERDLKRFKELFDQGAGSQQLLDQAQTAFKKAKAQLEATDAQIAMAKASIQEATQETDRTNAQKEVAQADRLKVEIKRYNLATLKAKRSEVLAKLKTAELNLSYCTIKAPISGYIAQKRIQVGDHVQPGQPVLAIVPLQDVYVEANFKETQLEEIRLGQPATIKASIYPDYTYRGKVAGIRAGTGAAFSLLPPENATGNWIKVVQRVPVRIRMDSPPPKEYPLRVGLSLEVTVYTADKSGVRLVTASRDQ
jgi:membrane fusion protein (multidrug efflux system)